MQAVVMLGEEKERREMSGAKGVFLRRRRRVE